MDIGPSGSNLSSIAQAKTICIPGYTGPSGATLAPNQVSGLQLWLKADAGVFSDAGITPAVSGNTVGQWNDQSGQGNHATQTTSADAPTYTTNVLNGLPAIQFNGTAAVLNSAYLGVPGTLFVVYNATVTSISTLNNTELPLIGTAVAGAANPSPAWRLNAGTFLSSNFSQAALYQKNTGGTLYTNGLQAAYNVNDILTVQNGGTAAAFVGRWGGISGAPAGFTGTLNTGVQGQIGKDIGTSNASWFNGNIYEIVAYSGVLTTAQYNGVMAWLQAKWGIALPTGQYYGVGMPCSYASGGSTVLFSPAILRSPDGINWTWTPTNFTPNTTNLSGSKSIQDPALLLAGASPNTGGVHWMMCTNYPNNGFPTGDSLTLFSSPDLANWTFNQNIDCSAFTGNTVGKSAVVNPSWFIDVDGSIHVFSVMLNPSGATGGGQILSEIHPLGTSLGATWSAPSGNYNPLGGTANINGPSITLYNGVYYQWYSVSGNPDYIAVATATGLSGPYTVVGGHTAGWLNPPLGQNTFAATEEAGQLLINGTFFTYVFVFGSPTVNGTWYWTGSSPTGPTGATRINTNFGNTCTLQDATFATLNNPLWG